MSAAILATTGGKGAYRIAGRLDFAAARRDPKPLVGFSDITILHLVLWQRCRLIGFHGPHAGWNDEWYGGEAAAALRRALMQPESVTVHQDPDELTAKALVEGRATGVLLGGNLDTSVGWACLSFDGAILLIEDVDQGDRRNGPHPDAAAGVRTPRWRLRVSIDAMEPSATVGGCRP